MRFTMKKTKTVTLTRKDHADALREGAVPEYALKPGRHTFRQNSFQKRHPDFNPQRPDKVAISIKLDRDIIDFFKERAAAPNAAPYQTQINTALRQMMERGGDSSKRGGDRVQETLRQVRTLVDAALRNAAGSN